MHAISHTLAHRAPPGSRTRVRWQPYTSLPNCTPSSSSSSKSSSPASYSTPATSIASPAPLCDKSDRSTNQNSLNCSSSTPELVRDPSSSKNKFALGLVDQAVKTLCDVWRPQDIPPAFSNPRTAKAAASLPDLSSKVHAFRSGGLLSLKSRPPPNAPTTTLTASSLASIPTHHTPPSSAAPPALLQTGTSDLRNLVPLRGFVHEVLRRSRTSGCVLQTALCYLEAIRPKISELAHLERIGKGTNGEPETVPRIVKATEEEIERYRLEEARELELGSGEATIRFPNDEHDIDVMDTVRIDDDEHSYIDAVEVFEPSRTQPTETSQSMPIDSSSTIEETEQPSDRHAFTSFSDDPALNPSINLPSPLLCPRRAFLAALILASKFTQDKCYSNRAWAKLTGLPAREIGRCERALGCALEWRLWVGKSASANAQASPNATPVVRSMARCQSEPTLAFSTAPSEPPKPTIASECSALLPEIASANAGMGGQGRTTGPRRTVRRASTLPAGSIANGDILTQFTSVRQTESGYISETTSGTLVTSPAAPAFQFNGDMHVSSPSSPAHGRPRSAPSSTGALTPSPDMPGLSYSPSSASSSSGSSSIGERTVQMTAFFDDCSTEYFNSPVARINTKLLVPGYGNGGSGFLGTCGLPTLLVNNCKPHAVANGDYQSAQSPSGYGILGNGISPQIVVDLAPDPPNGNGLGPFRFGFGSTLEHAPVSGSDGLHYERGF